jgi:F0F1-type ATP synthase beta subunit
VLFHIDNIFRLPPRRVSRWKCRRLFGCIPSAVGYQPAVDRDGRSTTSDDQGSVTQRSSGLSTCPLSR